MKYVNAAGTPSGNAERLLLQALSERPLAFSGSNTAELMAKALAAIRAQSLRALADDLRRSEAHASLIVDVERAARCGHWVNGWRWRATRTALYRSDVDPAPDAESLYGVGRSEVLELIELKYLANVTERIPAGVEARLRNLELSPMQAAEREPWLGWFDKDGLLAAVIAPLEKEDTHESEV